VVHHPFFSSSDGDNASTSASRGSTESASMGTFAVLMS
jgi:hypothetical protein